MDFVQRFLWTDSAVVLRYLANTSARFQTFVANRVRQIRELSSIGMWRHIPGEVNPADLASRGLESFSEVQLHMWFEGPAILSEPVENWPRLPEIDSDLDAQLEFKGAIIVSAQQFECPWFQDMYQRSPSWLRLIHRVAWLTRFKHWLLVMKGLRANVGICMGVLKLEELQQAALDVIRLAQAYHFQRCFSDKQGTASYPICIRALKPYLHEGIIMMNSRISHEGHIPILPHNGRLVELLVRHFHETNGHVGPYHVLALIRRQYWIVTGMASVKRVLSSCMMCCLMKPKPCGQVMAPLPTCRVEEGDYPFQHCGIDFFGPFHTRNGRRTTKRFGCLFTCFEMRAIHFEVVSDLSTDSFLMALNRFVGRRGVPKIIYCDNGSNLTGAETELRKLVGNMDRKQIAAGSCKYQLEWQFNIPYASHRGGVWERLIRSVRAILNFTLRQQTVTDEVLHTCMVEAERIVNDRPLVKVYDDPNALPVIRPNDLLMLRSNSGLTGGEVTLRERLTRQWRQAQHLANTFWKRWRTEYVSSLQRMQKWSKPARNLREGDVVILLKPPAPRGRWPKGVVVEAHPGTDGFVRQVTLKLADSTVKRDVRSLCLLEEAHDRAD